MDYCSKCGHPVEQRVPEGDDRHRHVCTNCGHIHYQNPRVVVGTLPIHGDRILLCKRAIKPRAGYWTLPAGFLENGETTLQGAFRETWEEARALLHREALYRIFDLPHINQIYMFYRAELKEDSFAPGPESTDVALFEERDIPWDELAFPVMEDTLRDYLEDRRRGEFPVRVSGVSQLRDI